MSLSEVNGIRQCNSCGERWEDAGDFTCPHCGSEDAEIMTED